MTPDNRPDTIGPAPGINTPVNKEKYKMEKVTNLIPFIIVGAIAFIALGQFMGAQSDLSGAKASYVQTVCDKARGEISGASERACGDAQDEAGAEYLCNAAGRCWVEVK